MKKALVLATALLLSLSANSYAETSNDGVKERKDRKERQYKGDREGKKMHSRESKEGKGKNGTKHSAAKKQCAEKCNLNKEKVRACRKKHGAEKGESLNGKCVPEKTKSCMKSCMQKHKGKKQDAKNLKDGSKKERKEKRQDRRANKLDSE